MLIVGLGNPGKQYTKTRHNVGFMVIDELVRHYDFSGGVSKKLNAEIYEGDIGGNDVLAVKPLTYMNNSGAVVQKILQFYKMSPEQVIVVHDELALPLCKVRVKIGGGDAGHNGLKSLDSHIGNNYKRVRIGIGQSTLIDSADYVLGKFNKDEFGKIKKLSEKIAEYLPFLLEGQDASFMNKITLSGVQQDGV